MFYQEGNDIRLNNYDFDDDNSVVSRIKGDQRYGLKTDLVQKDGDTMTGKLTTQDLDVKGSFTVSNSNNFIDFKSDAYGKLLYKGTARFQIGADRAIVKGMLRIEDGIDSSTGLPIDGRINMNNRKIVNLLNPEDAQDAATKNYVDDAVAGSGSGGDFIKANGDTTIDTKTVITLDTSSKPAFEIKTHSGTGFKITNSSNQTMLYQFGNDMRLANNQANGDTSILNRFQLDERYLNQNALSVFTAQTTFRSNSNAKFLIQNAVNNTSCFSRHLVTQVQNY